MPLQKEKLKAELRSRLGDPSLAELPDTQAEYALDSALREFSRYRPKLEEAVIQLEADRASYELPAGTLSASDLWVSTGAVGDEVRFLAALRGNDFEALHTMGAFAADDLAWDWDVEEREDTDESALPSVLTVHPTPGVNMTLFVRLETALEWSHVSRKNQDALLTWAQALCLEYIGRKRSKSVTKIPTAAGQLSLNTGYNERADGREFKKEFRRMMGGGATVATSS